MLNLSCDKTLRVMKHPQLSIVLMAFLTLNKTPSISIYDLREEYRDGWTVHPTRTLALYVLDLPRLSSGSTSVWLVHANSLNTR
jgi:hypothetical protein